MTFAHLADWIGRTEEADDVTVAAPLAGLAALLDHDDPPWRAGELPPLGHWCSFLPRVPQHDLAVDGHPNKGGFLPPVPLPRRMWSGGSFTFAAPIPIGVPICRRSTIASVTHKAGRSGALVFVDVDHEVLLAGKLAVHERQELVYREAPKKGDAAVSEASPDTESAIAAWQRQIHPDPVLLFRFSALTFNAHRIHYDREYCRDQEGYPGLVVHGPLTATLLMDLFLRNHSGAVVTTFRFRAHRPLFDTHAFTVCGAPCDGGAHLWAIDHTGRVAMTAELQAVR
jgi:3-methylfumaryl-CoA hydratase